MSANNVIFLKAVRDLKEFENGDIAYRARILGMSKVDLLDEMVRFQEERAALGHLTVEMMIRGKVLFKALEENAETQELRLLTKSYRRHLEYELAAARKKLP